jgi:hypothetical protein
MFLEESMRSELIFGAMVHVPNRYQLTKLVALACRALHRPGTRVQDTMNDVLTRFGQANPVAYLQTGDESANTAVSRKKPHPSWGREAMLELERIIGDQSLQVSGPTAHLASSLLDSSALPPGVLFTTVDLMLPAQHAE